MMTAQFKDEDKIVKEKIDTTNYFLTKMKENKSDITRFRYNLAAFLCVAHTARAVLWDFYNEWFRKQSILSDEIGLYFWHLRDVSVHERSPNPKLTTTLNKLLEFVIRNPDGEKQLPVSDLPRPEVSGGSLYYFEPLDDNIKERIIRKLPKNKSDNPDEVFAKIDQILKDRDVITLCGEYVHMISDVWEDYKASKSDK